MRESILSQLGCPDNIYGCDCLTRSNMDWHSGRVGLDERGDVSPEFVVEGCVANCCNRMNEKA